MSVQVVVTERERRDSELEHRSVLEECKRVMDEYRAIERKLRSHIVKSRFVCVRSVYNYYIKVTHSVQTIFPGKI